MKEFLLEIGTEEIPARFLPGALDDLKRTAEETLRRSRIGFDGIKTLGTPRRLVVMGRIEERQEDLSKEVFGPAKKAAFNPDGTLTKAAMGFAASVGAAPESLTVKVKGKGEYVAAVVEENGLPSGEVLPDIFKKIVLSLQFPKSMRWGEGSLRFVRPIHWIVALYGEGTIEFEMEGIRSGNTSRGHRFLAPGAIGIKGPDSYIGTLENNFVIVEPKTRRKLIMEQAEKCASSVAATLCVDAYGELLDTVTNLVEYPVAVLGGFDEKYLKLPDELIKSVLIGHQKYFPVAGGKEKNVGLVNHFIVVGNTKAENASTVRAGAERVVRARLEDARFYFEEDGKIKLIDRLEELKKVTYQEKLGSLHDKTMRLRAVAERLADKLNPSLKEKVGRAALLSKCDLITGVVREFPELQGIMGMHYAAKDGESYEAAFALRDQYRYEAQGGYINWPDVSAILALSDRMDNIVSFFSVGLVPTGSEDPFALRRQAIGIILILMDKGCGISLKDIAVAALGGRPDSDKPLGEALKFFEQRLEPLFESKGYAFDLIQSVIALACGAPLGEVVKRLDALMEFKSHPEYNAFLTAIKRVRNIVPERELPAVKNELLKLPEELALYEASASAAGVVSGLIGQSNYKGALEGLVGLSAPINLFFDKILVMDKDEAVRDNRLSLLKEVWGLSSAIADLSKLQEA